MGEIYMIKRFTRIIILSLLFILIINSATFAIIGIENQVSAYLLGDFETGEILEEYNIYKPMEIASITKLMSYLVIMEEIEKGTISMDDMVYIDEDVTRIKGSSLNLEKGEIFTVEDLLKALIVVSANDATYALAKYTAGIEEVFVRKMNDKAKSLGLDSAIFFNCTGLPEGELQNMMSPMDIFTLSRYIIDKFPEVLSLTTIPEIEIPRRNYKKENTNPLLKEIEGIDGLKTGFTNKAGYCLVSTLEVYGMDGEHEDFRLIGIVMGTESEQKRKEMAKELIQYGLDNYSKKTLTDVDTPLDIIHLPNSRDKDIEIYPSNNYSTIVKTGDSLDIDIKIDENIKLPLKELDKVGKVILSQNGEKLDEIDLIVHDEVKKERLFTAIFRHMKDFLSLVFSKLISG
ncbi:D-alanyl-D-alanine carboxypeptidase [Clostridium sp. Cult3]|nr:D-alanyl-D-alanine carboxypeptidase [Clostridium sp. Cult3]